MKHKLSYIYFVILTLLIASCVADDVVKVDHLSQTNKYRCFIRVPASNAVTHTRSASNSDIDFSKFTILVFDENNKYLTNADLDIVKNPPKYDEKLEAYELIVSLPITEDLATLVFIANIPPLENIEEGSSLTDFYDTQRLNFTGKWGDEKSNLVPMWGEINDIELTGEYTNDQMKVSLLRSMAKVDLQTELVPEVFTISSAHIYLSLADGLLIPQKDKLDVANNKVSSPSLIPNTPFNVGKGDPTLSQADAKQSPLSFTLYPQIDSETIFIPEQGMSEDGTLDCFVVIGGFFRGQTTETYYKVSFGGESTNKAFNILRNHRYILNIKQVNGLGYPTAHDAMEAPSAHIEVDVVEWDENINDGYVFGDKYFGIHDESIYFDKPDAGQLKTINFQTNLSDETLETELDYKLSKASDNNFELVLNVEKKQFEITTFENSSRNLKADTLSINMYGRNIRIPIGQSPGSFPYYIDCDSTSVHGVYIPFKALNNDNFIEVMVNSDEDLTGSYYRVYSDEIDGISFFGEGTFKMKANNAGYFTQKMSLRGKGTPKTSFSKYLNLYMNTNEVQNCSFDVQMIFSSKKIVGQSLNRVAGGELGYVMNAQYSKLFRESAYNFGSEPYSTVKVEGLDYSYLGVMENGYNEANNAALQKSLSDADILVTGRAIGTYQFYPKYTDELKKLMFERANIIADFIKAKGVAIIMEQDKIFLEFLFKALYSDELNISFVEPGPLIGYPFKLVDIPGDKILNGPFGDMNGKSWGADGMAGTTTSGVASGKIRTIDGLPPEDIVIYSNGLSAQEASNNNISTPLRGALILRHLKYNLFLIINDGFLVGASDKTTVSSFDPFAVQIASKTYIPVPKLKFGGFGGGDVPVYNSAIFGNIMNWALDRAEFNGRYSDPY